ncbi:MAG TPA: GreA/GreB family elongation factor [Candidatus Limnocylindria bacterium]|jgi:hypothetical protein|nr:GreA/GreB family elongation factor [Candidatus Limnocylindria bacterium]
MSGSLVPRPQRTNPWPLTVEARQRLDAEIARLRDDLTSLTSRGLEEGIVMLPVAIASKRLDTLRRVLAAAEVVTDPSRAAIGRRVTLREKGGEMLSRSIGFPGDGDPDEGCISADSPLGSAILGACAGENVEVDAPAGRWSITVVSVD